MPPIVNTPEELHNLLQVASVLIGPGSAVPPIDENILDIEAFLRAERGVTNHNCQANLGADEVCGLPRSSPAHYTVNDSGHEFVESAGVAQSGERLPRKQEAVGSIPAASSKGFTEPQREKLRTVVHRRVSLEESRDSRRKASVELETLEKDYKAKRYLLEKKITDCEERGKHYQDMLLEAEDDLRKSIVEDLVLRGREVLESKPAEEKPEPEQHEELGRPE